MTTLAGANALSPFRAQQLQPALVAIHPKIAGISARFVHLVSTDHAPTPASVVRCKVTLAACLEVKREGLGETDGAGEAARALAQA